MAKESDHLAGTLRTENTGGVLTGLLAEENEFDRRALWRIGTWGATAVGAVVVAVMANQSSIGLRRDQLAAVDLSRQAQQLQTVARESQNETRRLAAAIDTLNNDRDRLFSRVTVLEQGLDSVTGAIARQNSADPMASVPVPAPAGPSPGAQSGATASIMPANPQPGATNQPAAPAIAPVASAAPAASTPASGPAPDKPRVDLAKLDPKAEIKSEFKPDAKLEPKLKLGAIVEAKPDSKSEAKSDKAKSEPKTAETKAAETKAAELKAAETKIAEAKTAEVKTAEIRTEPKIEAKSDVKSDGKSDRRSEARSETKSEAKSEAKHDAKSDLASVPAAAPTPHRAISNAPALANLPTPATLPTLADLPAPAMTTAALFPPAAGVTEAFPSMIGPPDPAAAKLFEPSKPASSTTSPAPVADAMAAVTPKDNEKETGKANESVDTDAAKLPVQRTEFAVDLGTANSVNGLRALWRGLRFNAALAPLRPIIVVREGNTGLGMQLRLAAGPLRDAAAAAKICASLVESERPCETTVFDGQRLAMSAEEAQPPAALKPAPAGKWGPYRRNGPRHSFDKREDTPAPAKPAESSSSFSSLFGGKR